MNSKVKNSLISTHLFRYLLFFVFLTTFTSPLLAQGDLLIYPKRVVFEGRNNIKKLTLANTGKDTAVYTISFLEYKMNEDGSLKIISESEEGLNFASSNVRFFPRKVVLASGEAQTVKVQIRNTQNLTDGEYRSHLYFRAEEDKKPLGQTSKKKDSTISVQLKAVFGIAIPCIIRKGDNTTTVAISDLQFVKEKNTSYELQFKLNRNGNMSTYGDFTINYITTDNVDYEVAKMKGVGVYTPGNLRTMKIKLNKPAAINFIGGYFKIFFTQNESKKVLTEAILKL